MAQPIENHGIIGDLRTIALVGMDGTIDFMCWPRFDSPSVFASLLDDARGGCFALAPVLQNATRRQMYFYDTNVLVTRFLAADGVAEISDFMVIGAAGEPQRLVRRVKAIRNTIRFDMRCEPQFDYARAHHKIEKISDTLVFASAGGDALKLRLRSNVAMKIQRNAGVAQFEVEQGGTAFFILEDAAQAPESPIAADDFVSDAFKSTSDFWRAWVAKSNYTGRWREVVNRSALVLKLLTSAEHGSIVAAPTFGLPEVSGGDRNWDYRFTWIRDAAFTVYAFLRLGHTDEANAFMRWLKDRASQNRNAEGNLHIMYRLDGGTDLGEEIIGGLRGYQDAAPVRVGNAAIGQLQLDIYGELMDAVYLSDKYGEQVSFRAWESISRTMTWLTKNWQQPDQGIWEIRSDPQEFLHSRLMCWVALDRAIRLARKRGFPAPLVGWSETRDAIYASIHNDFWNESLGAFVQSKNSNLLDASCLLMPLVRFISPTDPRWLSTLAAVGEHLKDDGLVYRYSAAAGTDGLQGVEGTFSMCSFWYVECVARSGDLPKARFLFEKILSYANHLGLYAEEIGPAGQHLGNFPQALTHLALVSAAYYLDRALG